MIFAIDGSSFLKLIDEQNTLHIPKYRSQNIACWCSHLWLLWTAFTCCCPLSWLSIWPWSEVVDSCFIHCHVFTQKHFCCIETVANNALNRQHIVFDWLWANTAPTLNTAFSLTYCSCKIANTLPSDVFNSSAILHNFNLQLTKTSIWSFWYFLGHLPNLGALSVQYHLCLYDHI